MLFRSAKSPLQVRSMMSIVIQGHGFIYTDTAASPREKAQFIFHTSWTRAWIRQQRNRRCCSPVGKERRGLARSRAGCEIPPEGYLNEAWISPMPTASQDPRIARLSAPARSSLWALSRRQSGKHLRNDGVSSPTAGGDFPDLYRGTVSPKKAKPPKVVTKSPCVSSCISRIHSFVLRPAFLRLKESQRAGFPQFCAPAFCYRLFTNQ